MERSVPNLSKSAIKYRMLKLYILQKNLFKNKRTTHTHTHIHVFINCGYTLYSRVLNINVIMSKMFKCTVEFRVLFIFLYLCRD